ncbi:MAG: glycosyltransferase family 2 protein, partial [Acetobacteraceae bacterium]
GVDTSSLPPRPGVSVIVPARNEAGGIAACVNAILASAGADVEVLIVDDQSTDGTAAIVREIAARDPRVRLLSAPPLPAGWSGKQHACWYGASQASRPVLVFLDADVALAPGAVAAVVNFQHSSGASLVSGFPHERTESLGEVLLIPLIHVLLLGYLPIGRMRQSCDPSLGAGCGQLMVADAEAYRRTGGHAMIRDSWHDGVTLPRAFRRRGERTDLFDATALAACRMYRGFGETWRGLSKNAHEGMATPGALPVWTVLLGGGLVAPFVLLPIGWVLAPATVPVLALTVAAIALVLSRLALAIRVRQSLLSVPLLPVGVAVLLVLQWTALVGRRRRASTTWRGRIQASA